VTNPQGPVHQDPSIWARPGDPSASIQSGSHYEHAHDAPAQPPHQTAAPPALEFPAASPADEPLSQDPPAAVKAKLRRYLSDPVSIILVLVIVLALAAAGLIAGELYARNRANNVVATATECVVQDQVKVSFGPSPFLLQHFRGHYNDISIHTAGHQIRNAKGMTADININNVDLHGSGDSKGTIGELDATITWTSDGIKETAQSFLPFIGSLVSNVATDPTAGTVELSGLLGTVTVKPAIVDNELSLQVTKVTAMGATMPHETAQSAVDVFSRAMIKEFPLGIHADSVQVTNDGVVGRFSTRDAPIPLAQNNPCFAHV
jgi:hypothetical protein